MCGKLFNLKIFGLVRDFLRLDPKVLKLINFDLKAEIKILMRPIGMFLLDPRTEEHIIFWKFQDDCSKYVVDDRFWNLRNHDFRENAIKDHARNSIIHGRWPLACDKFGCDEYFWSGKKSLLDLAPLFQKKHLEISPQGITCGLEINIRDRLV